MCLCELGKQLKSGWIFCILRGSYIYWTETPTFARSETLVAIPQLTPEQEAEAQRWTELVLSKTREELLQMNRLLVSKPDSELLGASEFAIRDRVMAIGAKVLETALSERKKGGTTGRA